MAVFSLGGLQLSIEAVKLKMALPNLTRTLIEKKLRKYCEQRIPAHAKSIIRLIFKIRGNSVTLIEERPLFTDPSTWVGLAVAQFRFNPKTSKWTLYCADRNSRWQEYLESEPDEKIETLLRHVDEDVTGIFWG
jgi:hypothetical protein